MTSPTFAPAAPAAGAAALTPSEQLLLAAASATPSSDGGPGLGMPSAAQVVEAVAAAILANEQAGLLALEAGTRRKWLGLKTVPALLARPTDRAAAAAWPAGTLEARALQAAVRLAPKGKHHVGEVAEACITYGEAPEVGVALDAWAALRARGVLGVVTRETTTLKVFRSREEHDVLTPDGAALAARTGTAAARALVDGCTRGRADAWAILAREVRDAFARMTRSDSGDSSSGDSDSGGSD